MVIGADFPKPINPVRLQPVPPATPGFFKGFVNVAVDEAGDTETIGTLAKVVRAVVRIFLAVQLIAKDIGNSIVSHMSSLADTFKILGAFKKIKTLVDNATQKGGTPNEKAQRFFKSVSAAVGVAVAVMTGFKLAENFMLLKIGNITKSLGKIPVIGAAILPFSIVFSGFEIVEAALNITASSLKIHDINKKVERVKDKINEKWQRAITSEFTQDKKARIEARIIASGAKAQALVDNVDLADAYLVKVQGKRDKKANALAAKKVDVAARSKIAQFVALIKPKIQLKKAEDKLKKAAQTYNEACQKYTAEKGSFDKLKIKSDRWEVIGQKLQNNAITAEDTAKLDALRESKIEKWKTKAQNFTMEKVKEGLGLGMTIFLTLFLITSVALTLVFPPAGLIAMPLGATIFLAVGGIIISCGFASRHFMKFWKPKPVTGVDVPLLA